jgi:ribosomal protein S6
MKYEILYLVGEPHAAEKETLDTTIETVLTECGAVLSSEKWEDRRKLAYPIRHIIRGMFVARRFEIPERDYWSEEAKTTIKDPVSEITKRLNLMDGVLRFSIVRAEGLASLQEFAMRKEEERLRHSQTPKRSTGRDDRRNDRKSTPRTPISSMPFENREGKTTPTESEKAKAPRNDKEIDEKLDEILNM